MSTKSANAENKCADCFYARFVRELSTGRKALRCESTMGHQQPIKLEQSVYDHFMAAGMRIIIEFFEAQERTCFIPQECSPPQVDETR